MAAGRAGCRYGSFLLTDCPPVEVEVGLPSDLRVAMTATTTPAANSTTTTVVMIIPQGVCFWLTIDLPFLAGGRPAGRAVAGSFPEPPEPGRPEPGRPGPEERLPALFGAEDDLRWAMVLPSGVPPDGAEGSVSR